MLQTGAQHQPQVEPGRADGELQIGAGVSEELDNPELSIHDDSRAAAGLLRSGRDVRATQPLRFVL
jgi:hypothetical protein